MGFEEIFTDLAANLGFGLPDLILVMTALGAIILFAKDYKIGLISLFMLFALEFVIYANLGWPTFNVIIAFFISLAILTISLYTSGSKSIIN